MNRLLTQVSLLDQLRQDKIGNEPTLSLRGVAKLLDVPTQSILNAGSYQSEKLYKELKFNGYSIPNLMCNGFDVTALWITALCFMETSEKAVRLVENVGFDALKENFKVLATEQNTDMVSRMFRWLVKQEIELEIQLWSRLSVVVLSIWTKLMERLEYISRR